MSAISAHKKGGPAAAAAAAPAAATVSGEALGMEQLNLAIKLQAQGNYGAALDTYNSALGLLMGVMKTLPDNQHNAADRERIKKLVVAYLAEAEKCKKLIAGEQPTTPKQSGSGAALIQTKQKVTPSPSSSAAKITPKAKPKTIANAKAAGNAKASGSKAKSASSSAAVAEDDDTTEAKAAASKVDPVLRAMIEGEILDSDTKVSFADVAGLDNVKEALREMVIFPALRPDLFKGLRRPPKGLLMFGPPGNGKTFIAKAVANESGATFFSISASTLVSKWLGDGEKLVRALFAIARERAPSIIFMDEIDSILSKRKENEHDAARRLKTEFLIQFDGAANGTGASADAADDQVVVIGATNMPESLDDAVVRRLNKQIFVPSPDAATRLSLFTKLLKGQSHTLSAKDLETVTAKTEGYSASDITAVAREAAYGPIRELGSMAAVVAVNAASIKPISLQHFLKALSQVKPSVSAERMKHYTAWAKQQNAN